MPTASEPLSGVCGAVVTDIDLRRPLCQSELAMVLNDLSRHSLLVFPGQPLSPAEQAALCQQMGGSSPVPFIRPIAEHPDVVSVARRADEPPAFDPMGGWHTDFSFLPEPPSYTLLQALNVPDRGGDTLWADQQLAYETLSPAMRRLLEGLNGIHSAEKAFAPAQQAMFDVLAESSVVTGPQAFEQVVHPVVVNHPVTARPGLYVNAEYTIGLDGLESYESRPLLEFLFQHTARHEFTCRWRWSPGDLVIWDNQCLQDMAMSDYRGYARRMLRSTVRGTRPQRSRTAAVSAGKGTERMP